MRHLEKDTRSSHGPSASAAVAEASAGKQTLTMGLEAAPIQRKIGSGEAATGPAPSGGGSALPGDVRAKMEGAFGADFSAVRVHQGGNAQAVGAQAYTQGNDIHFAPGQYDPRSTKGQELLGHELAHVVQQSHGRVQATAQAKGVALNDDAGLEHEADAQGQRAARGEPAGATRGASAVRGEAAIQRKIGDGGHALVGAKVIETGKRNPWEIKATRGEGEKLEYQIDLKGLIQKWVSAHDEAWSLHEEQEAEPTEEELRIGQQINGALSGDVDGSVEGFESNLQQMADMYVGPEGAWSGGASDCVIVGCFTGKQVMLTHVDRTSASQSERIIRNAPVVYLASEVFRKGGVAAAQNGNVKAVMALVSQYQKNVVVFTAKQMGISPNGDVFTRFAVPKQGGK